MALVYFDSSALVKLVVQEPGSALAIGDPELVIAVWDRRLHAGAATAGLRAAPADLASVPPRSQPPTDA